jgi:hypothetical protein
VQLWGCAKPTHTKIIQRIQSKTLRLILNAPWYVSNKTIHEDLGIPYVEDEIKRLAARYLNKLSAHSNDQVRQLSKPLTESRRLKRQWPTDLSSDIPGDLSLDKFSSHTYTRHPIYSLHLCADCKYSIINNNKKSY